MTRGEPFTRRWSLQLTRLGMFLGPLAVALASMPALNAADLLYPDLVSDWGQYDEYPSGIEDARVRPVEEITWDGSDLLVVRFDGFVTNIGDGPLRIAGNPQTDSVYQWLLESGGDPANPSDYQTGPKVSVIYETDDGHNHWHLKNAQEYALWNFDKTTQVTVGSKVGFCLYDIGQIWATAGTRYYNGVVVQFCDQNDPTSTTIEMGVTPGWKDVYGYSVSQQWVDISAVAPGVYWLSTQTDTSNQIVESDETNNGLAFHSDSVTVPGYLPTAGSLTTGQEVAASLDLGVIEFVADDINGAPVPLGPAVFTITRQPDHGGVTVESDGTATYTPDPGFSGTDSFDYSVHDGSSDYPTVRPEAEVSVVVSPATPPPPPPPPPAPPPAPSPAPEDPRFDDVPADHPFFTEITWLAIQGITNGCGPTTFCPEASMTRAQLASFLVRSFGLGPAPVGTDWFDDDNGSVHEGAINALASAGITTGCDTRSFCADQPVTRAEWASFLARALFSPVMTSASDPFSDDDGSVHEGAIGVLWDQGLTTGCAPDAYCPDAPVTRGQLAAFLYRQLGPS